MVDGFQNNIAWALRHLPVFGVFGGGSYPLQPIYVDDLADLCVAGRAGRENVVLNAFGPETFTYLGMAETIARLIGVRRPILPVPPATLRPDARRTYVFLDTEFTSLVKPEQISIGAVATDATAFYAEVRG